MSVGTTHPLFEIGRIGTAHQHGFIVIGLNYQVISDADSLSDFIGNFTHIGCQDYCHTLMLYLVAHAVHTVMRHME